MGFCRAFRLYGSLRIDNADENERKVTAGDEVEKPGGAGIFFHLCRHEDQN
jgi:hypothetical protein